MHCLNDPEKEFLGLKWNGSLALHRCDHAVVVRFQLMDQGHIVCAGRTPNGSLGNNIKGMLHG
jgi:hypothetical protein